MIKQYRDYGNIVDRNQYTIPIIRELIDYERKGDVYRLTHDGEGKSLSFMNKAFISFTYGGKKIEDFGLIATSIDNRYNGLSPPAHEDLVTEQVMLNGQYYWGSHYLAREIHVRLATDGMNQKQLDDFKNWFQPGEIRELIFAEHPNRGILARISEAPNISIVPFKQQRIMAFEDFEELIEVGEYKGNILLTFTMDEPFWYAIHNILGLTIPTDEGYYAYTNLWITPNGAKINILDEDAKKVVFLDNVPTGDMINTKINTGEGFTLIPTDEYKYTLTNLHIEPDIDSAIDGTPLVNDELGIQYPLSGAIIGPYFYIGYSDDEEITTIPDAWLKRQVNINLSTGIEEFDSSLINGTRISMLRFLPVKQGSKILWNARNNIKLRIYLYDASNKNYITYIQYTLRDKLRTTNQVIHIFDNNYYIRLCVSVEDNTLLSNYLNENALPTFNKELTFSLITYQESGSGILDSSSELYYFYSGNAPSYPNVNFSVPLHFNLYGYIDTFSNEYTLQFDHKKYNTLLLQSNFLHELKLTNPGIFNSYNKVINKLLDEKFMPDIPSAIQFFRNEIGHPAVRNWIIGCINVYKNTYNHQPGITDITKLTRLTSDMKNILLKYMPYFFADFLEANIEKQSTPPPVINTTGSFIASYSDSTQDKINNNQMGITVDDTVSENIRTLTVEAVPRNPANNEVLEGVYYYQWQWSPDGQKWYTRYESLQWHGVTTSTLINYEPNSSDENTWVRCAISNNAKTFYTAGIELIPIDWDILITQSPAASVNTVYDYGQELILTWMATGFDSKQIYISVNQNDWIDATSEDNLYFENVSFEASNNEIQFSGISKNQTAETLYFKITLSNISGKTETSTIISRSFKWLKITSMQFSWSSDGGKTWRTDGDINLGMRICCTVSAENYYNNKNSIKWEFKKDNEYISVFGNPNLGASYKNKNNYLSIVWKARTSDTNRIIRFTANGATDTNLKKSIEGELPKSVYSDSDIVESPSYSSSLNQTGSSTPDAIQLYNNNLQNKYIKVNLSNKTTKNLYWEYSSNLQTWEVYNQEIPSRQINITSDSMAGYYRFRFTVQFDQHDSLYFPSTSLHILVQIIPPITNVSISASLYIYNVLTEVPANGITLTASANNWASAKWQIYESGGWSPLSNGSINYTNSNTITYTINNRSVANLKNNRFKCVFQDIYGSETSTEEATITFVEQPWKDITLFADSLLERLELSVTILLDSTVRNNNWNWPYLSGNVVTHQLSYGVEYDADNERFKFSGTPQTLNPNSTTDGYASADTNNDAITAYNGISSPEQFLLLELNLNNYQKVRLSNTVNIGNNQFGVRLFYKFNNNTTGTNITFNTSLQELFDRESNSQANYLYIYAQPYYNSTWPDTITRATHTVNHTISTQEDTTLYYGSNITSITLTAPKNGNSYTWQTKNDANGNWTNITGNTKSYTISSNNFSSGKQYRVIVISGSSASPSKIVTLVSNNNNNNNFTFPSISNTTISLTLEGTARTRSMPRLLKTTRGMPKTLLNSSNNLLILKESYPVILNCSQGEYKINLKYNTIRWPDAIIDNLFDPKQICYVSSLRYGLSLIVEESAGDMILFNNFVFNLQNHFDLITNQLKIWEENDPTLCHKLTYDGNVPLQHFFMIYKNLYL